MPEYEEGYDYQDEGNAEFREYPVGEFCAFCHHRHARFIRLFDNAKGNAIEVCTGCVAVMHQKMVEVILPQMIADGDLVAYDYHGTTILAEPGLDAAQLEELYQGMLEPIEESALPSWLQTPPTPATPPDQEDDLEPTEVPVHIADTVRAILEAKKFE